MARSKFNIRQLDILSSSAAMSDKISNGHELDLDNALFIMQMSGSGGGVGDGEMRPILGSALHDYFSHIDVDTVDTGEHTLLLIDPTAVQDEGDGFVVKYDAQGTSALSFNAETHQFGVSGSLDLKRDSVFLRFGEDQDVSFQHVPDTGLLFSGAAGTEFIQFGDSNVSVGSSQSGQLDLDASGEVEIEAPTVHITASSAFHAEVLSFDVDATGQISLSGSSNGEIQLGSSLDVDADGIDVDSRGALNFDASGGGILIGTDSVSQMIQVGGDTSTRTEVELNAITLDLNAGTGGLDVDSAGDINLSSSAGAGYIQVSGGLDVDSLGGTLNLDGAQGINIGTYTDVAVNIDAAALNIDASGEMAIAGEAGVLIRSTEAAADAIIINASDTDGGIDLIASGSDASLSGLSIDADSADFGSALQVNVDSTTGATSKSTGALVVDGGVGIAENLYVGGNLIIEGDTTTVETTNMVVEDPIIQLGSASAGNAALDGDRGFVFSLSGSANRAFWWDHDASEFVLAPTEGSSSDTELSISGSEYASLRVGTLVAEGNATLGNASDDTVTVNAQTVNLVNVVDTYTNDEVDQGSDDVSDNRDYMLVFDHSAGTVKGMILEELGQFLASGTRTSTSGSQGVRVVANSDNNDEGQLGIEYKEELFAYGDSDAANGQDITLEYEYGTEILDNSLAVFLNGQLLVQSKSLADGEVVSDYSVSSGSDALTLASAMDDNDVLTVRYIRK